MTTLTTLIAKAAEDGFSNNFRIVNGQLFAEHDDMAYTPKDVKISNFYRFEGESNPDDEAVLYLLETHDGIKGIVVNGYGPNAEQETEEFINAVNEINKITDHDRERG